MHKNNKSTYITYVVPHIINYQHVSNALGIIIRVVLQLLAVELRTQ